MAFQFLHSMLDGPIIAGEDEEHCDFESSDADESDIEIDSVRNSVINNHDRDNSDGCISRSRSTGLPHPMSAHFKGIHDREAYGQRQSLIHTRILSIAVTRHAWI